ncbi:hypothetical protein WQQ_13310 [Hydrocarboniphaga effusa AP103]|uniref:Uncharacterized protein n=1 Tax=Hydrocarboniphaga effusa AP103 TaxID=1172194 RepID=I7ZH11_9GAMM|nr:hypothetical protein WQQ_13310 [Hydrocarboniphaga effusa AP103]
MGHAGTLAAHIRTGNEKSANRRKLGIYSHGWLRDAALPCPRFDDLADEKTPETALCPVYGTVLAVSRIVSFPFPRLMPHRNGKNSWHRICSRAPAVTPCGVLTSKTSEELNGQVLSSDQSWGDVCVADDGRFRGHGIDQRTGSRRYRCDGQWRRHQHWRRAHRGHGPERPAL